MPTAPPSSREVSLSAEATPCFSGGSVSVIASVDGRHRQAHAQADHDQARQDRHVAALDRGRAAPSARGRRRRSRRPAPSWCARRCGWRSCGAIVDIGIITSSHRQHRRGRRSADQPSTAWKYGNSTRNTPNITANTISSVTRPGGQAAIAERADVEQRLGLAALPQRRTATSATTPTTSADQRERRRSSPARGPRGCRARARRWRRPTAPSRRCRSGGRWPPSSSGRSSTLITAETAIEHERQGEHPAPGEHVDHERRHEHRDHAAAAGEPGPDADRLAPCPPAGSST